MSASRRRAVAVKIHCPISALTFTALLNGNGDAIERDPAAAAMLAVIRADNPLGDFKLYNGVCEISPGWESFQPGPDAKPTMGSAGERPLSPTAIITTYADADADLAPALDALMAAHPWEIPVIELSEVQLLVR